MSRSVWITALIFAPFTFIEAQQSPESAADPTPQAEEAASMEHVDAAAAVPAAEEACFYSSEIRDFDALSDRFVLLETIRREVYLLTMFEGCVGLRSTIEIALVSDLDRVCSNSTASIRYRGSRGHDSCPIIGVESVEDKAAAVSLAEMRE